MGGFGFLIFNFYFLHYMGVAWREDKKVVSHFNKHTLVEILHNTALTDYFTPNFPASGGFNNNVIIGGGGTEDEIYKGWKEMNDKQLSQITINKIWVIA